MRLVRPSALRPGMVLARNIYDHNGQVVMREGTPMTDSTAARLVTLRIPQLAIEDPRFDDLEVTETIEFDVVREVLAFRRSCREAIAKKRQPNSIVLDVDSARSLAQKIGDAVHDSDPEELNLVQYLPAENYWDAHAINSALLAGRLAKTVGMDRAAVGELILACLIHDLSLVLLPASITGNLGRLSGEEKKVLHVHPRLEAEILRNQGGVSAVTTQAVGQHHELWNGSGYPRGLKGDQISPSARVISLVDTYTALISERPFRQQLMPHEAIEYIMGYAGELFEMNLAERFARAIPTYFVGIMVRLSNKQKGVVVFPNIGEIARPKIRALTDPQGVPLRVPQDIDLKSPDKASLLITAVVDE